MTTPRTGRTGRKILLVTTDQQRYDTLGCNGGTLARTPVVDRLAAEGVRYDRAVPQSVVCMPSRSTVLTGQHPSTHGVWMNGVALPVDAPSVAAVLHRAGYRTALVGKPHFEPFIDPFGRFAENGLALAGVPTVDSPWADGTVGPHRGFDHLELATHGAVGPLHYARWLAATHPEAVGGFYAVLDGDLEVNAAGGGATGAPQVKDNPIPRDWYHTDWVADRTIAWLDGLDAADDWFCWMSFPDPHHPWDPPASEMGRVDWREVPLPAGLRRGSRPSASASSTASRGTGASGTTATLVSNYEAPTRWVPATLTADQVREVNARNAVEVELIDEALGRVLAAVAARGWADDLDVVFTTDHGELQGDFGLLFKGPYHVDGLMRLPLVWRPAPSAGVAPAVVTRAGRPGRPGAHVLRRRRAARRAVDGGRTPCPSTTPTPAPAGRAGSSPSGTASCWASTSTCARSPATAGCAPPTARERCTTATEGELYDLDDDPLQRVNRWDDPALAGVRDDLVDDLRSALPPAALPRLPLDAPV